MVSSRILSLCQHTVSVYFRFRHSHGGHWVQIRPEASLARACVRFQVLSLRLSPRILPMSPTPAVFDERVIDVGAPLSRIALKDQITQEKIAEGARFENLQFPNL